MSDENPTTTSLADVAKEKTRQAEREYDNTVEEIKENFDLLLEMRDRQIAELQQKVENRTQEKPKLRLLVVDDAESTSDIVNRYLECPPVEVAYAASHHSVDQIRSENYDAIMIEATNVIEPDVDGMAFCGQLCEKGKGQSVIVLSSRPGDRIKNAVEEADATFLRKPFRRGQLIKIVQDIRVNQKDQTEPGARS